MAPFATNVRLGTVLRCDRIKIPRVNLFLRMRETGRVFSMPGMDNPITCLAGIDVNPFKKEQDLLGNIEIPPTMPAHGDKGQ
jgi:hypothetical protein